MEIEKLVEIKSPFQEFKNSAIQDILKHSLQEDIQQSARERLSSSPSPSTNFNISEVTENLILTSAANVDPHLLETQCISCVVNVAPELPDTPLEDYIIYHKIDISDSSNSRILPYFDDAADIIHEVSNSGGRTLVFCVAGVSRSASICLAYLMKHKQMSLFEAYNYLKARRPRIKPNCGFFKQLIEYEKNLTGTNTVHMVFNEFVQMEIPDVYDSEYRVITNFSKKHRVRRLWNNVA